MGRILLVAIALGTLACSSAGGTSGTASSGGTGGGGDAGADSALEPESGSFRALAYNVAGLPQGLSSGNPEVNTIKISPLLNGYDLVLVQEDFKTPVPNPSPFDFYHEILASQAMHPHQSVPAEPPQGNDPDRPSALVADGLNRFSQFPFGELTRQRWDNCFGGLDTNDGGAADCLSLKGFSVATHTFGKATPIDVYNLHVEAGGTALDQQYQGEDIDALIVFINQHSAGRAILLGGDTNLHTEQSGDGALWQKLLDETGSTAVCDAIDCAGQEHRIDRFLFRNSAQITITPTRHNFETQVFIDEMGEDLSDHQALLVEFDWAFQP